MDLSYSFDGRALDKGLNANIPAYSSSSIDRSRMVILGSKTIIDFLISQSSVNHYSSAFYVCVSKNSLDDTSTYLFSSLISI